MLQLCQEKAFSAVEKNLVSSNHLWPLFNLALQAQSNIPSMTQYHINMITFQVSGFAMTPT
jgi:hypothetical protein